MESFATLDELKARLEWVLDEDEERIASGALESLTEDARFYGRESWTEFNHPRQVKNLVLKAAARFMRNPDGYVQSRAGDETLGWTDRGPDAGEAHFTQREEKMLRALGGNAGITSVPISAWGTRDRTGTGHVPVAGYPGEKPFPYFADPSGPW